MSKILFVLSSHPKMLDGKPTGWYLPEAAHPYYVLSPHYAIEWASPEGKCFLQNLISITRICDWKWTHLIDVQEERHHWIPPVSNNSRMTLNARNSFKTRWDRAALRHSLIIIQAAQRGVENTQKLSEVSEANYVAIFYVGGHGPCFDLAENAISHKLIRDFYTAGKPTAAVCHGPVAFLHVRDAQGKHLVDGKRVTCFTDEEETQVCTPKCLFRSKLYFVRT